MQLGEWIRRNGYNYRTFGEEIGVSFRNIEKWSRGETLPRFNKAKLITEQDASTELSYDANNKRAMQTIRNNNVKIEDGHDTVWKKVAGWKGRTTYEKELVKRYIYVDNIETTYYSANGYELVEEFKNNKTY